MQIADIPERWQTVLRYVQNVAPDAVIAGGALRDLDNGRPVKDIDIFVQGNAMADLRSLREKLIELGFDCDDTDDQKIYPVGEGNDVVGCIDARDPAAETPPLQFIVVRCPPAKILDRIDFGICRLAFDGSQIIQPAEYDEDKARQVFRLRYDRAGLMLVTSIHRYARLSQKYEAWKFELFDPFDTVLGAMCR